MFAKSISVEKELKNPPPNEFNQKPEFVSLLENTMTASAIFRMLFNVHTWDA